MALWLERQVLLPAVFVINALLVAWLFHLAKTDNEAQNLAGVE
jgi:hypothetical protein